MIVETRPRSDCDFGRIKPGVEDVVGAGSKRLNPLQLRETADGVFKIIGGIAPSNEDLGICVFVWDGSFDVVWDKTGGKAFERLDIEDERGWV